MRYISFGCKDTHFAENLTIYFSKNAENLTILSIIAENLIIYFSKNAENLTILPPLKRTTNSPYFIKYGNSSFVFLNYRDKAQKFPIKGIKKHHQ